MQPIAGGFSARNLSVTMGVSSSPLTTSRLSAADFRRTRLELTGSDRYDIDARTGGNPGFSQGKLEMIRPLLADRFQLTFHRETRQMTIYSLTICEERAKASSYAFRGSRILPARQGLG